MRTEKRHPVALLRNPQGLLMLPLRMLTIEEKDLSSDLERAGYKRLGVQVTSVPSFAEAEPHLKSGKIQVVLISADHTKAHPFKLLAHLKQYFPDLPLIVTAIDKNPKEKELYLNAGADLCVDQPIQRQTFVDAIRKLLDQKTRATERFMAQGQVEIEMDDGAKWDCPIADLSLSGILLESDLNIKPGTPMILSFVVDGFKKPIRAKGSVVRRISDEHGKAQGLGVKFESFIGDSLKRMEKYMQKTQASDPKLIYYL